MRRIQKPQHLTMSSLSNQQTNTQVARHCTNAPSNAYYSSSSPTVGVSACAWVCNAGYYQSGLTCKACIYSGFNSSVHRITTGCLFTCKPFYFADAKLACTQRCNDLLADYRTGASSLLPVRVSGASAAYFARGAYFVRGACGSSETLPNSNLPFLQRGRWAFVVVNPLSLSSSSAFLAGTPYNTASFFCGNALLDRGEGCDDGNSVSGDGCSSTCTVESRSGLWWDCDVIGAPCLPNCGWQTKPTMRAWSSSLQGFVLPACNPSSSCDCTNISNYHVESTVPAAQRADWMRAHFVPCDCGGNAQRTVPYANCTAANRGCRLCPTGQYHDDILSQCVGCGTNCAPGFISELNVNSYVGKRFSQCSSAVSTSAVLRLAVAAAAAATTVGNDSSTNIIITTATTSSLSLQLSIGCVQCSAPGGGISVSQVFCLPWFCLLFGLFIIIIII
jgi:cysteine-rich repeat protein